MVGLGWLSMPPNARQKISHSRPMRNVRLVFVVFDGS